MASNADRKIVMVTRRTRLEELVARFHTLAQAKFYIEHLGQDFHEYELEHMAYMESRRLLNDALESVGRYQIIDRGFLPNFLFGAEDVIVALGQDGLVANTMKYLNGQPLIGINPDPYRYDGILLPFEARDAKSIIREAMQDEREYKDVTMAMASLGDGQMLYAVNDLFIGPKSHVSARYEIKLGKISEVQSSSGIIVSTGLGSTGWMKSVVTGSVAISQIITRGEVENTTSYKAQAWDTNQLRFAVREPFPSRSSSATLVFGVVTPKLPLVLTSQMPENGVIFSDGIEADNLDFNAGAVARITIADRKGRLVV